MTEWLAGKLRTVVGERRHRHDRYPVAMAATSAVEPHRVQDGPAIVSLGYPMASDRGSICESARFPFGRTTPRVVACVPGRDPLGVNFRQPMERFTRTISLSGDMLETAPRLDSQRRLPSRMGPTARQARPVKESRLAGVHRRRLVFTGKKGGDGVGRSHKGNGTRIMLMVDANGTPLSAHTTAAHHSEVHRITTLVDEPRLCQKTRRLLYDKAADADWLRDSLALRRIELVCAHRSNRTKPSRQDGRALRRYVRRYRIERSISWLHNYRRLITRWEYYADLFQGFLHLACMFTILKRF
jgi:transposase